MIGLQRISTFSYSVLRDVHFQESVHLLQIFLLNRVELLISSLDGLYFWRFHFNFSPFCQLSNLRTSCFFTLSLFKSFCIFLTLLNNQLLISLILLLPQFLYGYFCSAFSFTLFLIFFHIRIHLLLVLQIFKV